MRMKDHRSNRLGDLITRLERRHAENIWTWDAARAERHAARYTRIYNAAWEERGPTETYRDH